MLLLFIDKFEFVYCELDEKLDIEWKSLTFFFVVLDDGTVMNKLSGCLSWDTLELFWFDGFHGLY